MRTTGDVENPTRYFRWLLAGVMGTALLASAVNVIVDPYYVFDIFNVDGFNRGKPAVVNRTGFAKTYMVERARANTVIIGASRVDVGLDPEHPAWPEQLRPVFNFGVPGSSVYDRLRYLQHAAAIHRPKLVLVSLDFGQFLDAARSAPRLYPPAPREFEERLAVNYENQPTSLLRLARVRDAIASLLSTTALLDSVHTVTDQRYDSPTALGFSSGRERFAGEVLAKGSFSVMRDVTRRAAYRLAAGVEFEANRDTSFGFRALRDLLTFTREQGMRVVLIIPASHVFEYELWDLFGFWEDFERWKRMIVEEIEAITAGGGSPSTSSDVVLWDFSGYSPENMEAVPPKGDKKRSMHWFWEPVHFTSELGGLMIASMMSKPQVPYGRVLRSAELCDKLTRDRTNRERYRENNPEQVAMLKKILGQEILAAASANKQARSSLARVCDE